MSSNSVPSAPVVITMHDNRVTGSSGGARADRSTVIRFFCGGVSIIFYAACVTNDTRLWYTGYGACAAFFMLLTGCLSVRYGDHNPKQFKYSVALGWLFTLSICTSLGLVVLAGLDLCLSWTLGSMVVFSCCMLMVAGLCHASATVVTLVDLCKASKRDYEKAMWMPLTQKGS